MCFPTETNLASRVLRSQFPRRHKWIRRFVSMLWVLTAGYLAPSCPSFVASSGQVSVDEFSVWFSLHLGLARRRLSDVGLANVEERHRQLNLVGQQIIAALSQGSAAIADVIVFVTACYSLRRARYPAIVGAENIVDKNARLFVGRGLEFTIIQIAYLYVLLAFPTKLYWISFQMVGVKFYVNAVLGFLNARQIRHGKGLYEEESSIERKPTPGAGLPSGLLFNAVDTRVMSPSSPR
ncbi:hypothetical protein BU15DRAFT_68539 [Melanogaster broomeanus]|nr:hypothetical protein BU15DRAFT_68539 [Melanogaster broomeanus]